MRNTLPRQRRYQTRAAYTRTNADLLVNDPDGFPSDYPPVWWVGLDSGGGRYPIGPNGPHGEGSAGAPAMEIVLRATALITGPLTAAPFRVLQQTSVGQPLSQPRWLTDPMLVRPDARFGEMWPAVSRLPRAAFWIEWIRSAIWFGLGAFICLEDENGQPLAGTMRTVHPFLLSTERDGGELHWVLGEADSERVAFDRDGYAQIGPVRYRLVVLRNPHSPVDTEGMSQGVFAMSPAAFRLASQVNAYAAGQFRAGIPNGYLKVHAPSLDQAKADAVKARWMQAHGGASRSIAVLNATTEFVPINLSPVDAALAEVKRLNVADVAYAFALDPYTLGAGLNNSATYTNIRDAWTNHRDFGLAPWIAQVEDTLTALLPGAQGVKVNLDGFANPPLMERIQAGVAGTAGGLFTVDEWRTEQGLPPLEQPTQPAQEEVVEDAIA